MTVNEIRELSRERLEKVDEVGMLLNELECDRFEFLCYQGVTEDYISLPSEIDAPISYVFDRALENYEKHLDALRNALRRINEIDDIFKGMVSYEYEE